MFKKLFVGALVLIVVGAVAVGVYDGWRVAPAFAQDAAGRGPGGQGQGFRGGQAQTPAAGTQTGTGVPQSVPSTDWVDQSGTVQSTAVNGLSLKTANGQPVWVQLGPSRFWSTSISFTAGDQVTVTGFTENGQFMAAKIVNTTTGQAFTLRNDAGQPLWTGGGANH